MRMYTTPSGTVSRLYIDGLRQPHLLIAGTTGSGKSVVINGLMCAIMYRIPFDVPDGAQTILIDPKRVELVQYRDLPHTVRYASEPETILSALDDAMETCERRYKIMQRRRERKYTGGDLYIIVDEFADLMTTRRKRVEPLVQRLAQIGRAARVHLIIATQTPIAKVLPTQIKCCFDARIGLRTRSAQDSRNILGAAGLETYPRYGEGYYMRPEGEGRYRIPMITEGELDRLVTWWTAQKRKKPRFLRLLDA